MEQAPVVIVGAGPTGLVLANLLGQAGVKTLLLEANPATVGEPRAVSIDDETLRVVQEIGLLDAVSSEIVSGYGSEYRSPRGQVFVRVKPVARPYGHARRNAFRQPVFEAQLRDGLKRFSCIDARFEHEVTGFEPSTQGVTVRFCDPDGKTGAVRGSYLIACDGARSPIREALGLQLAGDSLNERWLIIDLEDSPAPSPETLVFCDPDRPGIALPGPRLTRRYEFKVMPGEDEADLLSDLGVERLLRAHGAAPGSRVVRKVIYHFHARIAERWALGRIILAGDAAHLMPPFAGQGMNGGIRDAANLAWKLAEITHGRIGPGLLKTYEIERRDHVRSMIRLALQMGSIFAPKTRLHGWATRAFFRALAIWPGARSYFAEMKYKPIPRFEEGFIVRTQSLAENLVGRMLPQPRLTDGALLDDRLGQGFVLLGIGLSPAALAAVSLGVEWDGLIARRVALAKGEAPPLDPYAGAVLLVRPDRYVMAGFAAADAPDVALRLMALLADTRKVFS